MRRCDFRKCHRPRQWLFLSELCACVLGGLTGYQRDRPKKAFLARIFSMRRVGLDTERRLCGCASAGPTWPGGPR